MTASARPGSRKQDTMFGSIGMPELIIIGPRKLPELGRSLGKSLAEFKKASNELKNTLEEEIRIEEAKEAEAKRDAQPKPAASQPPSFGAEESVRQDHSA